MIPWYYLLPVAVCAFEIGQWVVSRKWKRERDAEFDRRMAVLREQANDAYYGKKKPEGSNG